MMEAGKKERGPAKGGGSARGTPFNLTRPSVRSDRAWSKKSGSISRKR